MKRVDNSYFYRKIKFLWENKVFIKYQISLRISRMNEKSG